jgi:hypothetical protein
MDTPPPLSHTHTITTRTYSDFRVYVVTTKQLGRDSHSLHQRHYIPHKHTPITSTQLHHHQYSTYSPHTYPLHHHNCHNYHTHTPLPLLHKHTIITRTTLGREGVCRHDQAGGPTHIAHAH